MLDVVAELKKKYPNVVYIILASENPKCQQEHDKLCKEIIEKINKLELQHNVIMDRGFASDEVLMSYIRTSSVVVLPYKPSSEFDVYAASGMARIILQTSTPLIVSNANLFNGMDEVVARANILEEWVDEISKVFDNKIDKKNLVLKRKKFIEENSWDKAIEKLVDIFKNAK